MKKAFVLASVAVLILLSIQFIIPLSALAAKGQAKSKVIIGYFTPPGRRGENDIRALGGNVKYRYRMIPAIAAEVSEASIKAIKRNPNVKYVGPDYDVHIDQTLPEYPLFDDLWGLHNTGQTGGTADADIDAPEAWDIQTGSDQVVIAVIDTGVDYTHVDLEENMWMNPGEVPDGVDNDKNGLIDDIYGWDFYNGDGDPMDDNSHGTHCSGTIAAGGHNFIGVTGVNWTARIMALKFLSASGSGSTSDAIASIDYVCMMKRDHSIPIVAMSNSWGGGGFEQSLLDIIEVANDLGILFVAAAGNSGANNDLSPYYPSSYEAPNVIAVAATDHNDSLAWFSSYGATSVDLAAPGVNILSTIPGGYGYKDGTSMATPHVSGVAGLIAAQYPGIEHYDIKERILNSVETKPWLGGMVLTGGRLNAHFALAAVPHPIIIYTSHSVDDGLGGNGLADPGETINMVVSFWNSWADATNVLAALTTNDPSYISVTPDYADLGDISGGTGANSSYSIFIDSDCPDGYIATFDLEIVADGLYAMDTFSLQIYGDIPILFVDDDVGSSYEYHFTEALGANGYTYMRWDVAASGSPTAADMLPYEIVIWNTGADWIETLTTADQNELSAYLNGGGKLFLSSQDVLWDIGPTPFTTEYLHVGSYRNDVGTSSATGVSGDPISQSMDLGLSYPLADYSDYITPDATAVSIFTNASGLPCALRYPASGFSTYRVVFLAFPFEAISPSAIDPDNQSIVMRRIVEWLQTGEVDSEPPIISDATGDTAGTTGEPVEVSATIADNVGVADATVHYTPIDGAETTVPMTKDDVTDVWRADVPVAPDKVGPISYYITAQDAAGNSSTDPAGPYAITVTDNDPPVAEAGSDQSVFAGEAVSFDGSGSSDNVGITSYSWDFDLTDEIQEDVPRVTATHTYETTGSYTVTLTVMDVAGQPHSDTLTVTVNEDIPDPTIFTVSRAIDSSSSIDIDLKLVLDSDDLWLQVEAGSYVCFGFSSAVGIPTGMGIASVTVYVECWNENPFKGNIEWVIGTGWLGPNLDIWGSNPDMPIHRGEQTDQWDVTEYVNLERLSLMELRINNNSAKGKKIYADHVYIQVQWGAPDTVPPAAVMDLAKGSSTASSIVLTWPATGDDGNTGTASQYDIRYSSLSAITEGNWDSATVTQCSGEPSPGTAGTPENFTVTGLFPATMYSFALQTRDEVPANWSGLSNVVSAATQDVPEMYVFEGDTGYDFQMTFGAAGPNVYANATVFIVDSSDVAVPDATVHAKWNVASDSYTDSGLTGSDGKVTLKSNKLKDPPLGTVFALTVENVTQAGLFYDSTIDPQPSGSIQVQMPLPAPEFTADELLNAYPNPGNPEIWMPFTLSEAQQTTITIHDATGRLVRTLDLGKRSPGIYISREKAAHWDGRNDGGEEVSSGIYFYTIRAGEFVATRKMIVAK